MTVDDDIRDALAAEPLGAPPSDRDRAAVDHAAAGMRRRRTLVRGSAGTALALAVVVLAIVVWPRPASEVKTGIAGSPDAIGPGELPDGWVTTIEPTLGWAIAHPADWAVASEGFQCRIGESSTIVSSNGEPPPYVAPTPTGCTNEKDWSGVPTDAVLVGLTYRDGGPIGLPPSGSTVPLLDTPFPLSVPPDDRFLESSAGFTAGSAPVRYRGDDRYRVTVWYGKDASDEAKADARRVVDLLRPPADPEPRSTVTTATVDGSTPSPVIDVPNREVALPRVDPDGGMDALLEGGTLQLDGECLVVATGAARVVIVWTAFEAHMVISADGALLDVVVDGQSQRPFDQVRLGGGYVDPAVWPVAIHDLPPSCADRQVFVSG